MNELIDYILNLDTTIFLFINGWHPAEWFDQTIYFLTDRWVWIPFYIGLTGYVIYKERNIGALLTIIAIGIAVGFADFMCASVIRPIAERLRPSNPENPISMMTQIVNDYRGGRYGFPSCHAANTCALATFFTIYFRRKALAVGLFIWVALQCYTRLYLGVHYPGDILIGLMMGAICASIVFFIQHKLRNIKINNKMFHHSGRLLSSD